MSHYESALIQARAFFMVNPNVTRKEFHEYFEGTQLPERYPGIQGLGFAPRVLRGEKYQFNVWPLKDQKVMFPIMFLEPRDPRNVKAIGFDMYSEPVRRQAMEKAAECDCAIVSGPIKLVQEDIQNPQPGFNLYLPFFKNKKLEGYIYSPFRSHELFGSIFKLYPANMNFSVYDDPETRQDRVLFSYRPYTGDVLVKGKQSFEFGGRVYTIDFQMFGDRNHTSASLVGWIIFILGTLITGFLIWMFRSFKRELSLSYEIQRSRSELSTTQKDLQLKIKAIENSLNGFDIVSEEGKFVYVNKSYLRMWGYDSIEEVLGTSPANHCVDPEVPKTIIKMLKEKGECDVQFKALRKDKSTFDVRMLAFLDHDEEGREIYPTTSVDVTATKLAEEKLRASENQLSLVTNAIPSLISYLDPDLNYKFVNNAYEKWFGIKKEDLLGKNVQLVLGERYEHFLPHFNKVLKGEEVRFTDFVMTKNKNKKYLNISYIPDLNANGELRGFVILGFDITEIQQAIMDRDQFLSIASHELKTPLTSLLLQSQTMARSIEKGDASVYSPQKINKMIHVLSTQVGRLNRLVEDMLDVSRIRTGKLSIHKEEFDLGELAEENLDQMKSFFLTNNTPFPRFIKEGDLRGCWDKLRIGQVMTNLLTNAVKYGGGNQVTVEVKDLGNSVSFSVRDEGIGISLTDQQKIFGVFERAIHSSEVSGLGLGLFITNQIVSIHQGKIDVQSEQGKGSLFTVTLPKNNGKITD